MTFQVDFGIFAHNEEACLPQLLDDLMAQDVFSDPDVTASLHLLANGCSDATVARARSHPIAGKLGTAFVVHDFAEGGKSRTWNRFVHDPALDGADILGFLDADVRLSGPGHLAGMVRALRDRADLDAYVSRPVAEAEGATTPVARLIVKAGGTAHGWRDSICGQCYLMRGPVARGIHLPIGLPVEDGFIRAMILTDCMEAPEGPMRIDGQDDIYHVFEPERSLGGLMHHQIRIVIGSAINARLFDLMRRQPAGSRRAWLAEAAGQEGWLGARLKETLPAWPYGWVPWHFLFRRIQHILSTLRDPGGLKRLVLSPVYFGFDLVVFVLAQLRMARGTGAGFW